MKTKVKYVNTSKFKSIIEKSILCVIVSYFMFSNGGSSKKDERHSDRDKSLTLNNSSNIMNIHVDNFEYCTDGEELLSFVSEDGEILRTYKVTGEDLVLYMPQDSNTIESAFMEKSSFIPDVYDGVEFDINLDYKEKTISVRTNNYDDADLYIEEDEELEENEDEKEEIENISPLKDKYSNINYEEILSAGFKVQGVTKINNTVLITCYDHDSDNNSRIYLYDSVTGKKKGYIILNTDTHVGGISYDKVNGIIYISYSGGRALSFDLSYRNRALIEKILKDNTVIDLSDEDVDNKYNMTIDNDVCVSDITDSGRNSTMYTDGKYIYVATFNSDISSNGELVKFKIEGITDGYYSNLDGITKWNNKKIKTSVVYTELIRDFNQGVLATEYNGKNYIITSQSYSNAKSIITVYEEIDDKLSYLGSNVIDHPGIESLHIDDNGKIICIFETGSCDIYETNMKKLLKSFDSNESVEDAIKQQRIYNNIDQAYQNIKEDLKYYNYDTVSFDDVIDVIKKEGLLDFFIGSLKQIPYSCKKLIELNSDFIDIFFNSMKVVPNEIKRKIYK